MQDQLGNSYEIAAMAAVGLSQSTRVTTTHSVDQNNRDNILGALRGAGSAVVSGSGQHPLEVRLEEKGGVAEIVLKNPWQSQSEERLSVEDFIKRFAAGTLATSQPE